jgi:hypothetical protein
MTAIGRAYPMGAGSAIYGGRTRALDWPAWRTAMAANTWRQNHSVTINDALAGSPDGSTDPLITTGSTPCCDWTGKVAHDSDALTLVATAAGYASHSPAGQYSKSVGYDLDADAWSATWAPLGAINTGHAYDSITSRPDGGGYIYVLPYNGAHVWRKRAGEAWAQAYSMSGAAWSGIGCMEYLPGLGTQGSVIQINHGMTTALRWDIATGARSTIALGATMPLYPVCHYVAALGGIVFGGGVGAGGTTSFNDWWLLSNAGAVSSLTAGTRPAGMQSASIMGSRATHCADPSAARSWFISQQDSRMYSLSWSGGAGTWTDHGAVPAGGGSQTRAMACLWNLGAIAYIAAGGSNNSALHIYATE